MTTTNLRIPPQNLESERALLGSIMLKPDGMNDAIDFVSPDSFYSEKHRTVFQGMLDLFAKSEPIDLVSLSSKLKEKKKFDIAGGGTFLSELVNSVPSASNLVHYAKIVQKKYVMRGLIGASVHIGELGYAEDQELEDLLDQAEKKVFEITNAPVGQKFISIKDTLGKVWDQIDRLHNKKDEVRGVPTGYADLDNLLAGFQKSDLIILAARPSVGKTALALDIARQAALNHNVAVGLFSLEMAADQLVSRMLAAESRVDAWKLRTGKLTADEEFEKLQTSISKLSKAPIYIDDKASNTIMGMRSTARRLKSEHGLGLIIIDYLQLITPHKNYDSMVNQITEISRSLKGLARELDVPVLALSQLSRAVEARGGKPRLSDLRDSGSIEQDADVVMFIHREKDEETDAGRSNVTEILVEKHRNGPTGKVNLYFDDKKSTFLTVDKSQQAGEEEFDSF